MVTAGRSRLAERAVRCFCAQTWANRELIIVDDGTEDYSGMLRQYRAAATIDYHRIGNDPARRLGALRNLALERARGDYLAQWDDDEWYHPERLETQMQPIARGSGASVLRQTLMHLDAPGYVERPYRTGLRRGTPGTVVFGRTTLRYRNAPRGEDSDFLAQLRRTGVGVAILGPEASHLFIRCFHGSNTWDRRHFSERLHDTARNKLAYAYARYLRRDLFAHRAFQLTGRERASASAFLEQSRGLGLCLGSEPAGDAPDPATAARTGRRRS
jgi:glycosyltransferase involved in cell wall biosynthesis